MFNFVKNLILLTSILCIITFAWADQLIIEPDMGRAPIINAINDTHYDLKLVMYGFTDETILIPILKKKSQGKTVKIMLDRYPYKAEHENDKIIKKLIDNQINWQGAIPLINKIHQKTLIIDGKKAIVMTFNFTRSAFKNERNFALILDSPKQVQEIENKFNADWLHKVSNDASDLIWSPENSRKQLEDLIKSAKVSIKIYAQQISDYKMIGALASAAKKGITIKILTSNKIRKKQAEYLTRAGVTIKRSQKYYIHAKTFIFDNRYAVIGSINLTQQSLDSNRELAAVTQDAIIIKQLNETFEQDWQASETF